MTIENISKIFLNKLTSAISYAYKHEVEQKEYMKFIQVYIV